MLLFHPQRHLNVTTSELWVDHTFPVVALRAPAVRIGRHLEQLHAKLAICRLDIVL